MPVQLGTRRDADAGGGVQYHGVKAGSRETPDERASRVAWRTRSRCTLAPDSRSLGVSLCSFSFGSHRLSRIGVPRSR